MNFLFSYYELLRRAPFITGVVWGGGTAFLFFFLFFPVLNLHLNMPSRIVLTISRPPLRVMQENTEQNLTLLSEEKKKTLLEQQENTQEVSFDRSPLIITPYPTTVLQKAHKTAIALIFVDVGKDLSSLENALNLLPHQVGFSFSPFIKNVSLWIERARQKGYDVFLDLPMESHLYPQLNKGPYTLRSNAAAGENLLKLSHVLEKGKDQVGGVYGFMGSAFLNSKKDVMPILKMLKQKGYLLFVSDVYPAVREMCDNLGLPYIESDVSFDAGEMRREDFDKKFQYLEDFANKKGVAVGKLYLTPLSLNEVSRWIKKIEDQNITLISLKDVALYEPSYKDA